MSRSVIASFRALLTTNDEGSAVMEYAVCLALIVLACILEVNALGVAKRVISLPRQRDQLSIRLRERVGRELGPTEA